MPTAPPVSTPLAQISPPVSAPTAQTAHRLPSSLPAIYRDDPFLGQYLWAFENLLLNLETQVGDLAMLFDPLTASVFANEHDLDAEEFLQWLSSWVAFTLRADFDIAQQQQIIAQIVPLYRRRGTPGNLLDLLSIFIAGEKTVVDSDPAGPAHKFSVTLSLPQAPPDIQLRRVAIAHALVDLDKPAHTDYTLAFEFPTMQIGITSTIGKDTLLGTIPTTNTRDLAIAAPDASAKTTTNVDAATEAASTPRIAKRGASHKREASHKSTGSATASPKRPRRERDADVATNVATDVEAPIEAARLVELVEARSLRPATNRATQRPPSRSGGPGSAIRMLAWSHQRIAMLRATQRRGLEARRRAPATNRVRPRPERPSRSGEAEARDGD